MVVDTFGFERDRALRLSPDDKVIGLYRAAYPDPTAPDSLELEALKKALEQRYGASRFVDLPEDLTFGGLYRAATIE